MGLQDHQILTKEALVEEVLQPQDLMLHLTITEVMVAMVVGMAAAKEVVAMAEVTEVETATAAMVAATAAAMVAEVSALVATVAAVAAEERAT